MADYYRRDFDRTPKVCESPVCENTFTPKHPTQRFCSYNCKMRGVHYRRTAERRAGRTCAGCGVSIEHLRLDRKWCSEACARKRPTRAVVARRHRLKKEYGLTMEQVDAMLEAQGGGCGICGESDGGRWWSVDHDHATGDVRGILCESCNLALGKFQDDPALLRRAIAYLEKER